MQTMNVIGLINKLATGSKFQNCNFMGLQCIAQHGNASSRRHFSSACIAIGQSRNVSRTVHHLNQIPVYSALRSASMRPGIWAQHQRFKSSDAWLEQPVVFKPTSPASVATKERGERNSRKVSSKVPRPRTKKPSRFDKGAEKVRA